MYSTRRKISVDSNIAAPQGRLKLTDTPHSSAVLGLFNSAAKHSPSAEGTVASNAY
ncbi:MAG: hypothetical protein WCC99_18020 [Candidatus Sulfotelmatobacter sp.]